MKNRLFKTHLICVFLFTITSTFGQGWEKTFTDGMSLAKGFDVIETQDGGYVIVGDIDLPTGAIRHHVWAVKTDQDGNELWSNIYDYYNVGYRDGRAIAETEEGDLLIVGSSNYNKGSVLKISADGDSLWSKYFGGNGRNAFKDIIRTEEGDFILVGEFEAEANSDQHELWGMGMNADGDSLWSKKYFSPFTLGTTAMDISAISEEDYLITGKFGVQGWIISVNGITGNQNWQNTFQFSTADLILTGTVQSNGSKKLLLGGSSSGFAGYSPKLIETNSFGVNTNTISFSTIDFGAITDIVPTTDAGYILTGSSYDFWYQNSPDQGFISKLNSDLELEWEIVFEDSLNIQGARIRQNSDGSYLMVGSKQNSMFLKKIGDTPDAIHGIQAAGFEAEIYPNPASDRLFIEIPEAVFETNMSIHFYDAAGKLVNQQAIKNKVETLDLAGFSNGFYTYLLRKGTQDVLSGKVLVQRD